MANVAQLVEPRFVVPVVVGSSPIVRPRLKRLVWGAFFIQARRFLPRVRFFRKGV